MKSKNIILSLATLMMLLFIACNSEAQNTTSESASTAADASIEVIQFHSEHRCMTCNKIEVLARETLKSYPAIPFSLVNVDDAQNEDMAEQFEAVGTALFLYNPKTGQKKDLTDFAFMNAGNQDKFVEAFKKEIDLFLKS